MDNREKTLLYQRLTGYENQFNALDKQIEKITEEVATFKITRDIEFESRIARIKTETEKINQVLNYHAEQIKELGKVKPQKSTWSFRNLFK